VSVSGLPDSETILAVERDLVRLGAHCYVSVKRAPRGKWETVWPDVETFEAALVLAGPLLGSVIEVGIFLKHERYGGIFIWTSIAPEIANRFEDYE
jgi:hypothetical protein